MGGIIQIAGLRDAAEAQLLVDCGVDWIGFPFRLDHHREELGEMEARAIIRQLPKAVLPVLITYLTELEAIFRLSAFLEVRGIQLHGRVLPLLGEAMKRRRPELILIRSLVIREDSAQGLEAEVNAWAPHVDYFLTDTFDPESGAGGATGKTHDWALSRRLVEISPRPLILAGGLRPGNVADAIARVRPAGVDAHTGVEDAEGRKDPDLLSRFVAEARLAFSARERS